ncbi:MAG: Flp family type IVb pilin [Pseudomonadota bacterium]
MKIKESIQKFLRDEEGLTAVEYAVAGGLVSLVVIGAFTTLGTRVGTSITNLANRINVG